VVLDPAVGGWILYGLLVAIVALMWRASRGHDLVGLIERGAREHRRVARIIARHPEGGSWPEVRRWLAEENGGP